MTRKQRPILSIEQDSDWWTVYQWLTHRFDNEEMHASKFLITSPVSRAIDDKLNGDEIRTARERVRETWRELQGEWFALFKREGEGLTNSAYASIVERTNVWLDEMLPAGRDGVGEERKRLLTAIRQMRSKERRNADSMMTVHISGTRLDELRKAIACRKELESDFVRAALDIVLASPELLEAAKVKSCV